MSSAITLPAITLTAQTAETAPAANDGDTAPKEAQPDTAATYDTGDQASWQSRGPNLPAVDRSLVAVVVTPDRESTFADTHPDVIRPISSWNDLPAVLQTLRAQTKRSGQSLILDLACHGNNGTGLKVVTAGVNGETASITSMAEVNRMVKAAGFAPGEIVILTEACNVNRGWGVSADGFTADERKAAVGQAEHLAAEDKTALATPPEFVDHGPVAVDNDYTWLGRGKGTNWVSTVFLQYVTGISEGAPVHDLRQYTNPKATIAADTDETRWVAAHRADMVDALAGTRFAVPTTTEASGHRLMDLVAGLSASPADPTDSH